MTNLYLYGTKDVDPIPDSVIDSRLELLRAELKKMVNVHFMAHDNQRMNDVGKAIEFWEKRRDNETI